MRRTVATLAPVGADTVRPVAPLRSTNAARAVAAPTDDVTSLRALKEIQQRLTTYARGARMQLWARTLGDLAAEIETDAAPLDVAVPRRLADRFDTGRGSPHARCLTCRRPRCSLRQ